jgi:LysM repeat protein
MPPDDTPPQKTRLTLTRCSLSSDGRTTVEADEFSAMINPSEITLERSITYNAEPVIGQLGSDMKFSAVQPEKVRFDLVLDGTGVVPPATPADAGKSVRQHLADLLKVVYKYDSPKHEPSRVRLIWGSVVFHGRMESMSTKYTLFKPSGDPLRARVSLSFVRYLSKNEEVLVSNRSSPDLSHRVQVRDGDTLPLLCQRIYGDPRHYLEVARFNGLSAFRRLQPGQQLHFPPLGAVPAAAARAPVR